MYNIINQIVTSAKAIINNYNQRKIITSTIKNWKMSGYDIDSIVICSPFGHYSIPYDNIQTFIIPHSNSAKSMINIGYIQSLDGQNNPLLQDDVLGSDPLNLNKGTIISTNKKWAFILQETNSLNGLIARKMTDFDYKATLPSGEFIGRLETNRIDDIKTLINDIEIKLTDKLNESFLDLKLYFDQLISDITATFDLHTHHVVSVGNPTSEPTPAMTLPPYTEPNFSVITEPADLNTDKQYIQDEKYLLNQNGVMYGN